MSGKNPSFPSVDRQDGGNLMKLTPNVIKNLTEELSEIVGEDVSQGFEETRNERGELLNEEGLPIIDITEPLATADTRGTEITLLSEDAVLPSLSNLSDTVREQLRQQRDRILDQLEEEERLQQKREEEADLEERQEILRKRKEAAAKEREKLKAAKEMQKKMGRALVGNDEKERTQEGRSSVIEVVSDVVKCSSQDEKSTKKKVAFADASEECQDSQRPPTAQQHSLDWGDLIPARLRSTGRPSLLPSDNKLPMKMTVVERTPSAPPKAATTVHPPDSDDESDLDFSPVNSKPDSDADDIDNLDADLALEEEFDLDFAQHQREIALEYHEKRGKIGAAALAAMTSHSHQRDGDVRVDIPLDGPPPQPEKPPISRFKAEHLISSYKAATSPSTSLGASVIPASTARTMQKAIRTGKLDADERLVGGDADSASEDENEGMQELVGLLQRGELYNLGPGGNLVVPPTTSKPAPTSLPASSPSTAEKIPLSDLPPIDRPKTSKFKLSRVNAGRPSGASLPLGQTSRTDTPISVVGKSPPKPQPAMTSNIAEKPSAKYPSASTPIVVENSSPPKPPTTIKPTVAERHPATAVNPAATSPFPSMIVDSPSFPPPAAARTTSPKGTVPMVVDSPPFVKLKPEVPIVVSSRPSRPPTIISSGARESSQTSSRSTPAGSQARPGKVSRFMVERS